jgi:hypothetical protein
MQSQVCPKRAQKFVVAAALAFTSGAYAPLTRADNPIVQTLYTADPAPLVYDGTVYLYTGHDEDNLVNNFFTMNDWRVYSSKDMVNWTDHGSPLSYKSFSWSNGDAWAGQVVNRNGKFYYYVPINRNGGKVLGVAVSDSPTGPFKDALGKPLLTSDCGTIDPTVFIDDDDQAYLYWGNPSLCYVKLNADMISYSGQIVHVPMTTASFGVRKNTERPTSYEEGPWFYKRDGRYYMVYAGGPISEHIAYATSTSPTGPWVYGGVVMPTQGASFTNHPGVIDFKGKSYFFYHNGALPGGGGYHRSVAVEAFTYGADGKFPQIQMSTAGPAAAATLNPYTQNQAETIAWESGIETEVCSEGGMNVTAISNGDYIKVKNVDFGGGATSFTARVAAAAGGGSIQVRLGSQTGTLVGTCSVAATGGAQTWANTTCSISGASGIKDLFFVFSGTTFNFNSWQFTGTGSDTGAGGAPSSGGAPGSGGAGAASANGGTTSVGGTASMGGSKASGGSSGGALPTSGGASSSAGGSQGMGGSSGNNASGGSAAGGAPNSTGGQGSTVAGAPGSGGAMGSGGSSSAQQGGTSSGGASAASGAPSSGADSEASCSCSTVGHRSGTGSLAVFGVAGVLFARSRRRRGLRAR